MCVEHSMKCQCGAENASFNFRDEIMPAEVVSRLYCPKCSTGVSFDSSSMLKDNGWLIEYDMDVARFMSHKLSCREMTPEFLFDQGYCTWRGVYPADHIESLKEREELFKLSKINPRKYIDEIKKWSIDRMNRLAAEGWRKATIGH